MAREGLGAGLGGAAGGILGSLFGPIGTGIGQTAGAGLGSFFQSLANRGKNPQQMGQQGPQAQRAGFWNGQPSGFEQVSQFSPEQQNIFGQLGQQGQQQFQNPYQGFDPIRQRAMTEFKGQQLPSLYERLNAFGENRASSPAFTSQGALAETDLAERLAALQSQYGLQSQQQALQLLQMGLTPQFQNYYQEGTPGFKQRLTEAAGATLPTAGRIGAQALGGYLGAPQGQGGSAAWSAIINGLKGIA